MNEAGYSFIAKSPFAFEFYTSFGAAYSVVFVSAAAYFPIDNRLKDFIYSIDIKLLNPGPYNHYDLVIGITVTEIIFHFFSMDERRIIFYICDPVDGRMKARKRKFDYWFTLFNTGDFKKIDSLIQSGNFEANLIFIFSKTNPYAYDLPTIIDQAKDRLGEK